MPTIDTLPIDKAVGHANTGTSFRQNKAFYNGISNAAGGSAGAAVTTTLTFNNALPSTNYSVFATPSQACFVSFANKTVNSVDVVLTPKDGSTTLSAGTFDAFLAWKV